jgi:hypothetical protein
MVMPIVVIMMVMPIVVIMFVVMMVMPMVVIMFVVMMVMPILMVMMVMPMVVIMFVVVMVMTFMVMGNVIHSLNLLPSPNLLGLDCVSVINSCHIASLVLIFVCVWCGIDFQIILSMVFYLSRKWLSYLMMMLICMLMLFVSHSWNVLTLFMVVSLFCFLLDMLSLCCKLFLGIFFNTQEFCLRSGSCNLP